MQSGIILKCTQTNNRVLYLPMWRLRFGQKYPGGAGSNQLGEEKNNIIIIKHEQAFAVTAPGLRKAFLHNTFMNNWLFKIVSLLPFPISSFFLCFHFFFYFNLHVFFFSPRKYCSTLQHLIAKDQKFFSKSKSCFKDWTSLIPVK